MSCPSTITEVVQAVYYENLDLTNYVANCEDGCIIIFGNGNPDISGLGVIIAYVLQVAVVCIFGPLLPILIWLLNLTTPTRQKEVLEESLYSLRKRVYDTHLLWSTFLFFSAIVNFQRHLPVLEAVFSSNLVQLQCYVSGVMSLSGPYHKTFTGKEVYMPLSWFLSFSDYAQMIIAAWAYTRTPTINNAGDIALACHRLRGTIDVSREIQSAGGSLFTFLSVSIALTCVLGLMTTLLFIFGLVWTFPVQARGFVHRASEIQVPHWIRNNVANIARAAYLLCRACWLMPFARSLFRVRVVEMEMSGVRYLDNEWGYGQTMAVLMWTPFVFNLVLEMCRVALATGPPKSIPATGTLHLNVQAATQGPTEGLPGGAEQPSWGTLFQRLLVKLRETFDSLTIPRSLESESGHSTREISDNAPKEREI
ncbi:hypothetical protein K504DRAFT_532188 [Pleomassaria siparia CBS 279.74]|uniref:Uncharacterized protein n=1 Tax=Pleomassaria siparia CBS 279.74 TaxID=1314801 RepID=A0A6G1KGF2_9PLEO|nr:hypothetical protein K504DRAFT_532188 [Pleomassaria siparia CBS 279.74]